MNFRVPVAGTILPYSLATQADVMQQAADSKGIPQLQEVVSFVLEEAKRQGPVSRA